MKSGIQVVAASAGESALTCFIFGNAFTEPDFFACRPMLACTNWSQQKTDLSVWGSAVSVDEYIFAKTGAQNLAVVGGIA